jgi:hypothetical protein
MAGAAGMAAAVGMAGPSVWPGPSRRRPAARLACHESRGLTGRATADAAGVAPSTTAVSRRSTQAVSRAAWQGHMVVNSHSRRCQRNHLRTSRPIEDHLCKSSAPDVSRTRGRPWHAAPHPLADGGPARPTPAAGPNIGDSAAQGAGTTSRTVRCGGPKVIDIEPGSDVRHPWASLRA